MHIILIKCCSESSTLSCACCRVHSLCINMHVHSSIPMSMINQIIMIINEQTQQYCIPIISHLTFPATTRMKCYYNLINNWTNMCVQRTRTKQLHVCIQNTILPHPPRMSSRKCLLNYFMVKMDSQFNQLTLDVFLPIQSTYKGIIYELVGPIIKKFCFEKVWKNELESQTLPICTSYTCKLALPQLHHLRSLLPSAKAGVQAGFGQLGV